MRWRAAILAVVALSVLAFVGAWLLDPALLPSGDTLFDLGCGRVF